jgi:hypothetical protein
LLQHVATALRLAREFFPTVPPTVRLEADPESDDQWVTIDVVAQGDVDRVLEREEGYMRALIASVPWPQRDKIRLAYAIT